MNTKIVHTDPWGASVPQSGQIPRQVGHCMGLDPYYGIHRVEGGWVCRIRVPDARQVWLTGEFNGWNDRCDPMLTMGDGNWVLYLHGENTLWESCRICGLVEGGSGCYQI